VYRVLKTSLVCVLTGLIVLPLAGCTAPNTPPAIVSLEARARVVAPGDSVLVECVAEDADGDALTYEWTSDRGTINGQAAAVAWTAPSEEGLARITVTVSDGGEESVRQSLAIVVRSNQRPVIAGVTADLDWVRPGESVLIRCAAEDGDGDVMKYTWSTTCGQISGEGDTVTWTAPDVETACTVTVVVEDGYDGRTSASVSVVSSLYEPLLIASMTVTPVDDPPYIVARNDWYKVYWEDSYVIECFVPEPGRIASYEWSDGGPVATFPVGVARIVFEGSPSRIRWTAPRVREEFTMTVTVTDVVGNKASKSITLYVDTCTCAFPAKGAEES
jgi:predicted secreted protein